MAETSKNKIYYNNDENSVADVLADMKKMAESADKAIENSKYDDTKIKTEKAKLETELKEMQEDFYQNSIRGQASGEYIHVEDSSNCRAKIGIGGNHEQETREGYNLLSASEQYTYTSGNAKLASDGAGKYIINSDGTSGTTKYTFTLKKEYTIKNNDYLHIMNRGTVTSNAIIIFLDSNMSSVVSYDFNMNNKIENLSSYAGKTIKYIQLYMNPIKVDITLTPMIINNVSTAKNFEQYGAMPSPGYLSEIKSVGRDGSVKAIACNKNLFDYKTITLNRTIQDNGNLDYSNYNFTSDYIQILPNKTYIVNDAVSCVFEFDKDKKIIKALRNTNKGGSFTTSNGAKYLRIRNYYSTSDLTELAKQGMLLEESSTSTSFEQHEEQSYIMPIQKEMLEGDYFDFDNEEEVHVWKKMVLDGNEKWNLDDTYKGIAQFSLSANALFIDDNLARIMSNYFKGVKFNLSWTIDNCITIKSSDKIRIMTSKYTTVEELKAYLKEQYNARTPVIVYYKLSVPERLKFTDKQKAVAKELKNARTYKNVTNITTDSKAILSLDYVKDSEIERNKMQNEIDEIKQLLSTTQTSAMLLDNLQKEVESEVE